MAITVFPIILAFILFGITFLIIKKFTKIGWIANILLSALISIVLSIIITILIIGLGFMYG